MKLVKYICDKCGYAKPMNRKELFFLYFRNMILDLVSIFGMLFIYLMILLYFSPSKGYDTVTFITSTFSNLKSSYYGWKSIEIKELATNISSNCYMNKACIIENGYYFFVENFNYTTLNSAYVSPKDVIRLRTCDCDTCSILYCSVMRVLSVECYVRIDIWNSHAYAVAVDDEGIRYKVDIAQSYFGVV